MSNDIDEQLRAALRRVDPEQGFAQRVLARIEVEQRQRRPRFATRLPAWLPTRARWLPVAVAASALLVAVLLNARQVRHERQGLEARQQLIDALRVAGEKLDLAYRAVNTESPPTASDDTAPGDTGA